MKTFIVMLWLVAAGAVTVAAQQPPNPADVRTIDGIINAYYEVVSGPAGGRNDVERDRTLHHPDAWIAIARVDQNGTPVLRTMTLDEYHGANNPRREGFYERETARETRRHGNMVSIWSSYESATTPDGDPYTSGVNTITLWWDGDRWWIMNWMFDMSGS